MRDQVDQCAYLRLTEITEPDENSLRLVVEELTVGGVAEDLVIGEQNLGPTYRIEHTADCRVFEIHWDNYVAYSVVNESYDRVDDSEESEGRLLRTYSKSHFLEYVQRATFADDHYPGPSRHVAVVCAHHIVNVISVSEPRISLLKAGQPRAVPDA